MNMVYLSISLHHLQFLSTMSYNFLGTGLLLLGYFSPRYFILFDAIVNGIVFLISLSERSLFMYRNATNFCILILHRAALLNSFISFNIFLVASLGFSIYDIKSSANSGSFTCFPFGYLLFHFLF